MFIIINALTGIDRRGQYVVVSFDKYYFAIRVFIHPLAKMRPLVVKCAVKQISQYNQLLRLISLYQFGELLQIAKVYSARYRDSGFTKMPCFAQMYIGYQKCFLCRPVDGFVWQQVQ